MNDDRSGPLGSLLLLGVLCALLVVTPFIAPLGPVWDGLSVGLGAIGLALVLYQAYRERGP